MNKIHLPVAELKPALIGLGKVIAKRTTLPVLNHIKIERTKDDWTALKLSAYCECFERGAFSAGGGMPRVRSKI
jgi:DNA polymerase III sliding clamp (beta) subunit (PCNA family)